ncbi:scarecrow-like protein 34 [Dorcoceras hygrometricum]|uniref:Scarecrow-like protein 34 n=1 Tax=Dorcoceras hygrometricum TaxID=472368 RepID=A0A2Z7DCZ4_9LAMI|nr:scarecrow-like protein 34 [Dorcoceras hygrometricum]
MQHAIIDAMKCMRAIKGRIARPVNQLANHLNRASIPRTVYQPEKSSVRDLQSSATTADNRFLSKQPTTGHAKQLNDVVRDTSPLLPTAEQKRYTQNATFQLNKTTSPLQQQLLVTLNNSTTSSLISDWFLKPTAGHSAGTIPHNATADSTTIQQSTSKRLTNTCHVLVNPRTRASAASRFLFKRYCWFSETTTARQHCLHKSAPSLDSANTAGTSWELKSVKTSHNLAQI